MKVEDSEETLTETVCSRVREQLNGSDADLAEAFTRQLYRWVAHEDVAERDPLDLYGLAVGHFNFARERAPGVPKVRAYNPHFEEHGWQSTHTAVEIVTDDMPFLIDSISMELNRRGFGVHLIIHPVLGVRRDAEGRLLEILPQPPGDSPEEGVAAESVIHAEVARQTDPARLRELELHLERVIADVRSAVEDWPAMRSQALDVAEDLRRGPTPAEPDDVGEAAAFLEWLEAHNFTFLGYREYELRDDSSDLRLWPVAASGLGILRRPPEAEGTGGFNNLPPKVRALALAPRLLNLTKANSRATVHRPSYLDYVGVKRFDEEGRAIGERRFLGLYTHTAYRASPGDIPMLRRKVSAILERAAFPPGSHNEKALLAILDSYPRDELFQISEDELFDVAMGILHLGERQRLRLFARRDPFGRFFSLLVFVPRDRFNTENRRRIEAILRNATGAKSIDYTTRVSESVLVRLHYMAYVDPGLTPELDAREVEMLLVAATRSWADDLQEAIVDELGEERGGELFRRFGDAFPAAYRADSVARSAVPDILHIEELPERDGLGISLYRPLEAGPRMLRAKLFRAGRALTLSDVLPLFENMGVEVADERPYPIVPRGGDRVWIYDFGLTYPGEGDLDAEGVREGFQEAFVHAWRGEVENDGYNRLVLGAALTWREITVLRAIGKYLRQARITFSDRYVEQALVANHEIARLLIALFQARFDPRRSDREDAADVAARIEQAIDSVESLEQDQILRMFLDVIGAMLRTNYFQTGPTGDAPHLSFKLDPSELRWLPQPRPRYEIFVYSPRTEGVHLRGGSVARGGIRWSERREDFRTEVLGLMKAQMVKNSVIVPVGAKGGFVVKQPPAVRQELPEEVVACYEIFIRGLLDLTDDIEGGAVVPPAGLVRYDGDDPYLVVAADKGTATFSDIANGIALEEGFWLGDAFASGGSTGYDHKKMGITARGAWESVARHFRELGREVQSEDVSVVGIGDMAGDVFGNGMLLSRHIRLIGAFNHRHVFIDPNPDPERSFEERRRLFELPGSSWADYDPELISPGGGVYERTAKSIPLSAEAREALGIEDAALKPNELIQALLRAPVDLLWNGGIGTYVKASSETHADAGDKANDAVRVNGSELRAQVVGEGGNLGLTQRARVEYALAGGRVNTDAIDNSGGVDCSDREVNIKVLLGAVVEAGDLTEKQRNALLAEMTDSVAALVLKDNYEQAETLSLAQANASSMIDVHQRFLRFLESRRNLDRELEALPHDEEIGERKREHGGLTRPELATLLAYSKIDLYEALLDSDVPEDPYLSAELERYFPPPLPERFGAQMRSHRLGRQIVATQVVNNMLHGGGITFAFRLHEETGAPASQIARAYACAREIFEMRPLWTEIEALDNRCDSSVQIALLLEGRRLVERASRWLLGNRPRQLDIASTVRHFRPGATTLYASITRLLAPEDAEPLARRADELREQGVPEDLATRVAALPIMFGALDIVTVADETELDVEHVAAIHFRLGSRLGLHWLRDQIVALPRDDRWRARARAALRDDLYAIHRELTREVLRSAPAGVEPGEHVDSWIESNPASARTLQTIGDIRSGQSYDLTTLPVAVREVRNLIGG
ncbi:MAG TPA: NAD-glutamate dehydrogenase, partial [Thermoleophilaceae bacterium]|nr:NAD-glutamate dehydrogenase [Thermoleophilaceae bacterium]